MKRTLFLTIFACFLAISIFGQTPMDPTVATVGLTETKFITQKQLRAEIEKYEKGAPQLMQQLYMGLGQSLGREPTEAEFKKTLRQEVLNSMIEEVLLLQDASQDRQLVTSIDSELKSQVLQIRTGLAQKDGKRDLSETEFNAAILRETKMDRKSFEENLRKEITKQAYFTAKKGTVINSAKQPAEDEIRSRFEMTRNEYFVPGTVGLSIIEVPYGENAAARTKARTTADALVKEIGSSGSVFNEKYNLGQSPGSELRSDRTTIPLTREVELRLGSDYFSAISKLNLDQISGVLEGRAGFQIVRITAKSTSRFLELGDLVPENSIPAAFYTMTRMQPGTRMTLREYIGHTIFLERRQRVTTQAQQELFTELRGKGKIEIRSEYLNW